jgi:hypothetical protein
MITYPHPKNFTCEPPTDYSKVHDVLIAAVEKYRPDLVELGVIIDTLICENVDDDGETYDAVKLHGLPAYATIGVNSLQRRALGDGDALIKVDGHKWKKLTEAQRVALMHHEIEHIELTIDEDEGQLLDDLGRPRFKLKPHSWELGGFESVARVHGENSIEVINHRNMMAVFGDVLEPELTPARLATPEPIPDTEQLTNCGICGKFREHGHVCSVVFKSEDFPKIREVADKLRASGLTRMAEDPK